MVVFYSEFSADELHPDVREALNDPDKAVREKAAEYLKDIEEKSDCSTMRKSR